MIKLDIQLFGGRGASSSTKSMTLDEYLASKGLSAGWYSDQGFADTNTGRLRGRAFSETQKLMQQRSTDYSAKRNEAIQEYNRLVNTGKIKEPSRYQQILKISKGNPNNPQVQAAKRLLKTMRKRGITK